MDKDFEKLAKKIDKLKEAVCGLLTVYGPSNLECIEEDLKYYFPTVYKESKRYLDALLEALIKGQQIEIRDDIYSIIPFNVIDVMDKVLEKDDVYYVGDKEFSAKDISSYGSYEKMIDSDSFKELRLFIDKNIKNEKLREDIKQFFVVLPYLFVETDKALMIFKDRSKTKFDENEFCDIYYNYAKKVPRYFLGGYSFNECNELCNEFENKENNFIKHYPDKKDYPKFTYEDLIELGKKISKAEIYKIIDSDRILELTINNKKVYVSILGFYRKDIGIIIYKDKEELLYTYHFSTGEGSNYPDLALRVSNIEVCVNDPKGFATDKILFEMKEKNYPIYPSFIRLEANHDNRLVNDEEIQIVGGVLSDLLTLVKTNDLSDISLHLGEKDENSYNIDQVYITENETIYGGYDDIDLLEPFLNFNLSEINEKKVNKVLKHPKKDITIGLYVYPTVIENDEIPYMIVIRDDETGKLIDMFLRRLDEMSEINNDILDLLNRNKICPKNIYVNNDYAYEAFVDFIDYFEDVDYMQDRELDNILLDAIKFNEEEERIDAKNFS